MQQKQRDLPCLKKRCGVLHYNKVLSAGNLILSDVANVLCQKRLRLMLAWYPQCEKAQREGKRESRAVQLSTSTSRSGGSDLHATPTV